MGRKEEKKEEMRKQELSKEGKQEGRKEEKKEEREVLLKLSIKQPSECDSISNHPLKISLLYIVEPLACTHSLCIQHNTFSTKLKQRKKKTRYFYVI